MQASAASVDQLNSLTQEQFQGCAVAYPKLINNYASDSIDAGTIDIQSNGDISLDNNVLITFNDGQIKASSATYLQNNTFVYVFCMQAGRRAGTRAGTQKRRHAHSH